MTTTTNFQWLKISYSNETGLAHLINKALDTSVLVYEIDGVYYAADYIAHSGEKAANPVESNPNGASWWFNSDLSRRSPHTITQIDSPKVLFPKEMSFAQSDDLNLNYDDFTLLLSLGDGRLESERFNARYSSAYASGEVKRLKADPSRRVQMQLESFNNYTRRVYSDFWSERLCAHFGNLYMRQLREFKVMEFLEIEVISGRRVRERTVNTNGTAFYMYANPQGKYLLRIKKS